MTPPPCICSLLPVEMKHVHQEGRLSELKEIDLDMAAVEAKDEQIMAIIVAKEDSLVAQEDNLNVREKIINARESE